MCGRLREAVEGGTDTDVRPRSGAHLCPRSGARGQAVGWQTVAALVRGPLPARQAFWLCRDPACEVVYFGAAGTRIQAHDLRVEPGFKSPFDGLLCYCFDVRRGELQRDVLATGTTSIPERIMAETRAGNCACEVRNPSGRCCLGEVRQFVASLCAAASRR